MDWQAMTVREPELQHIARSCKAARQQGANWHDFWTTHHVRLGQLVGPIAQQPALRSDRAYQVVRSHLLQIWINAMSEGPAKLPWDSRPLGAERQL